MRVLVYLLFVAFAAPFEIVFSWYVGWWNSIGWLASKPLADGMLYFFSLTICFETIFRALGHCDHPKKGQLAKIYTGLACSVVLLLMIDFLGASWPHLMAKESVENSYRQQWAFAILAIVLSGLSFKSLEVSRDRSFR